MKNVPLPKTQHGNDLSVIRVRNVDEGISKLNDNIVSDGRGL